MEGSKDGENTSTSVGTGSFYGSRSVPLRKRFTQVAKRAEYSEQHPLPKEYQPGILGPPITWKVFRRQAEAIKFARVMGMGLMVFSFESDIIGTGGKRNFIVTHPNQMWLRQEERLPKKRCSYEVIQEESVCKMYFDLEFMLAHNPRNDGVAMTNTLICIVCYFLQKEFGIACLGKDIIILKGTSPLKFSRHLIFNIPGVAFATNADVGRFLGMVCNKIWLWKDGTVPIEVPAVSLQNVKDLFVLNSSDNEVLFCDQAVYSKNRNFRLFLSTKLGQNFPLLIARENEYKPKIFPGGCEEKQMFLDSLITLVDSDCKILTYKDAEQPAKDHKHTSNSNGNKDVEMKGYCQSPYPEIDDFIQSLIGSGSIHSWHYFSQREVIVYNIVQYRFCHNINREHKRNNIMYVVNVKEGMYYQKCHDPDCSDFRSSSWPLPKAVLFWQAMNEEEVMDWIHSAEEEDDTATNTAKVSQSVDDDAATGAAMQSSQDSSLSSNPWERLSQLSSPNTSFVESFAQSHSSWPNSVDAGRSVPSDFPSDEGFLEAVLLTEKQLLCADSEVDPSC
ncbi:DNA-directed primase/polymerase protein-like [Portunus trituberculatus]|uniref:DNA-directed primase/polymerase protein n=1 Tax=Portunus trituberculatus TaxID=210409 RepID=A0A5B7DR88_PORTR|nr:DNA-directed primase/polymerase protein-like [Portunus trituberculatus]XP_045108369.1 DNA-directed primase/polymerase protein-like [Portunus trituberculatus]MPC23990.1 DNA-directed primase/polymerase protein [Portunus trituberculatus]